MSLKLFTTVDIGAYEQHSTKTFYIRPTGGTAEQCTGRANSPYPGSGSDQAYAWSHPFWAAENLYSDPSWKISGGDTLFIYPGAYKIGHGAPNTDTCDPAGAFACTLPPLPAGLVAQHATRILGTDWDLGCTNAPELWGTERAYQVLDLTGASNAILACLEITDHAGCVEFHSNPAVCCARELPPFGNWAGTGVVAADSDNVMLQDLNIHGLASAGIRAGRISNWSLQNVRIAGNGWVGWDGDIYGDDSNSGELKFRHWLVEWNGCAEKYPEGSPDHCWDQSAGGYGDGVGTGISGGHWQIEDSIFRYNTSDGLDLLYIGRDTTASSILIKRTRAYGNAGNQLKTNGPTSIENCLLVGNCAFFECKPFGQEMSNHCRAAGAALALGVGRGDQYASCDGSESLIVQNSIFRGYQDYFDPLDLSCYFWFDSPNAYALSMDHNVIYNAKVSSTSLLGPHDVVSDPLFVNDSLDAFDAHLQGAQSPAIDSGLAVGSLVGLIPDHNIENVLRPQLFGLDRGAYEYQADAETGSLTVTIEPAAAAAIGARWRVEPANWKSSGEIIFGLSAGDHAVTFMEIAGWTAPVQQTVTIITDQTTLLTAVYQQDPTSSILWQRQNDGLVSLWTVDETDNFSGEQLYGPFSEWHACCHQRLTDGTGRLLWQRQSDGLASLWTLDAAGNFVSEKLYGPFSGWRVKHYHRTADGTGRILWQRESDGLVSLWAIDAAGGFISERLYGPFTGWEVRCYHGNPDGAGRILWQRESDDLVSLWTVDANDNFAGEKLFGPFTDWMSRGYD